MMTIGDRMRGSGAALRAFLRSFASSSRGNVAMIFAITLPILVMITMGGVDINRAATVRVNLQDALDAATLAAARSPAVTQADLTDIGTKALRANLQAYPNINLASATFSLNADQVVIADASVNVKTLVANIVLPPYGQLLDDTLPVGAHSEVNRSSKNIEVGLVLDITGSMAGTRIIDLKAAAAQLVDIVVQKTQTPYYTRMSIIPYSIGVNMDSYANGARGTPIGARSISDAQWKTGTARSISGVSSASKAVVTTTANHGYADGTYVWISGILGTTGLNDKAYRVVTTSDNKKFTLQSQNSSGNWVDVSTSALGLYLSGGTVQPCLVAGCQVVVTATNHGIPATTTNEGSTQPGRVYITGVNGLSLAGVSMVNNRSFEVANVTANTYSIPVAGATVSAYGSGGSSWCGQDGCQWRVFRRKSDNALTQVETSTCVSERTGSNAYTDISPSSAPVGRNYDAVANPCPSATILPLTDSISTLKSKISGLTVTGSTAGQIGLAWGWYTVSPNFNSLWSGNPAGQYDSSKVLKAVILMTDGDFNSPYCTGVLAGDAGSGSGSSADHINCDATNGDPFEQAAAMCAAIKFQHVIVYTVGFSVTPNSQAANILKSCATGPDYAFLPASGEDLKDDFAAIGRDITRLRISK